MTALVDTFAATAAACGSVVHLLTDTGQLDAVLRALAGDATIVVAPSTIEQLPTVAPLSSVEVTDVTSCTGSTVGVTLAVLGVAETGSVLVNEPSLEDRLVSAWPQRCVVVLPAEHIVGDLITALAHLETCRPSSAVLISGPSRTADIERSLTVGVQGPRALDIVVLP